MSRTRPGAPLPERLEFYSTPEPNCGCLLWTGFVNAGGYGMLNIGGSPRMAHRISYEVAKGPIPDGLTIDHLCRVRSCINPSHLEVVTLTENVRRADFSAYWARPRAPKTHCFLGHPYDEANTYYYQGSLRQCRECRKRRDLEHKAKRAAMESVA